MRKLTYLAVFEPSGEGYSVYFPDLPGCISYGASFEEARHGAVEALGLHLYGLEKAGEDIPEPTARPNIDPETADEYLVSPISAYPDIVRNEMDNRAARINLTVPTWLKEMAENKRVNYSQVMTAALMDVLDIHGPVNR